MSPLPRNDSAANVNPQGLGKDVEMGSGAAPVITVVPASTASSSTDPTDVQPVGWRARLKAAHKRFRQVIFRPEGKKQWFLCILFWIAVVASSTAIFATIFPRLVDRVINPLIRFLRARFTWPQLAAIAFGAHAILPCFLVLPWIWISWLVGAVFPFWWGLAIISAASIVGIALQYALARYGFLHKWVLRRLELPKNRRPRILVKAADLMGPWKFVFLLRLGAIPPYQYANYLLAIPPSITWYHNLLMSIPTTLPRRALTIFFGQSLDTIADLLRGRVTDPALVAYRVIIMVAGFVLLAVFGWFAKKAINKITAEEEEREKAEEEARQQQQEAEAAATAAAGAPADVEAGLCAGGVVGAKDVDAVPTSGTGADQQQQQQQQPQQQAEAGVPRMVWQDSDLALKRGLGPNSK